MIPKLLLRIWLGPDPIPPDFEAFWEKFRTLHPSWDLRTFTDADDYSWLRNRDLFERAETFTSRSDVLRFELLERFGGIYVDVDVEPIRAFDPLLSSGAFAGWESGDALCGAVLGAESGHPAIRALVEALPSWTAGRPNARPAEWAGPRFLTAQWAGREDVRLYEPAAFYPWHWNAPPKRGRILYPKETYARHHWAKSWRSVREPSLSIVVPWTDRGDEFRSRVRNWSEAYWRARFPRAEFLTGTDGGRERFNRSAAINDGARKATGEVLLILDADAAIPPGPVGEAVRLVSEAHVWVTPFRDVHRLTKNATLGILGSDPTTFVVPERPARNLLEGVEPSLGLKYGGFAEVVPRAAFEEVGGFDERFEGWGSEDIAFMCALDTLFGPHFAPPDAALHLWHHRPAGQHSSPENLGLEAKYRRAYGNRKAMGELLGLERLPREERPSRPPEGWTSAAGFREPRRRSVVRSRRPRSETPKVSNRPPPPPPVDPERISILVPFRDDGGRGRAWDWLRKRWPSILPGAEIVVGTDGGDGVFSKTKAVNDAYRRASGDVFVVADADAWMDAKPLLDAAARTAATGALYVPWTRVLRYGRDDSEAILAEDPAAEIVVPPRARRRAFPTPMPITAGTLFVISRASFEKVGGMDPRFRGWGYEDTAFSVACFTLVGRKGGTAEAYSLFHPRPLVSGRRVWENDPGVAYNHALLLRYTRATRKTDAMRKLVAEHPLDGETVPWEAPLEKVRERIRI